MITKEKGKAVFRYRLFSDEEYQWLPRTPKDDATGVISVGAHSAVGGINSFIKEITGTTRDISLAEAASSTADTKC
jgi:hypothetical protein